LPGGITLLQHGARCSGKPENQTTMNRRIKWVFILTGIAAVLAAGYFAFVFFTHAERGEADCTKEGLIHNYESKHNEINVLHVYIDKIVPEDRSVDIEFDSSGKLAIFHVMTNGVYDNNWEPGITSSKTDSLLNKLGWTRETLKTVKHHLDDADCISIESGEPATIGYRRKGLGKYFYKVFGEPLSDSLKKEYNDSCNYIFYKDNIVLEYRGGEAGPQCFEAAEQKGQ
jgi:hypothetical protein